jgi:hypothetical protein
MGKPIKWIAAGDSHGDLADWGNGGGAVDALFEYIKDFKPDVRIALGDHFDFRSLRMGAGQSEQAESLQSDIDSGCQFLTRYKPDVWLWGNHEHRLDNTISMASKETDRVGAEAIKAKIMGVARKAGCKTILPYHAEHGVYRLGPMAFIHGYAHGSNAVMQQGSHYASNGGGVVMGHIHRLEQVNLQKHGGGAAYSAGCLCVKDSMSYASHRLATSRWGSGWAAGWVDGDDWKCWLIHKVGKSNKWVWQTELKVWPKK